MSPLIIKERSKKPHENQGFKHECGHFCADTSNQSHCCRCQNPENGYAFLPINLFCKICKGTMRKYGDGFYYQKCPVCGKISQTINHSLPILAPLVACSKECSNQRGNAGSLQISWTP